MANPQVPSLGIILCVYRDDRGTISHLKIQGLFDPAPQVFPKKDVVNAVKSGANLHVLWTNEQGDWSLSPPVHVVKGQHLATDPNETTKDNLGEVAECES